MKPTRLAAALTLVLGLALGSFAGAPWEASMDDETLLGVDDREVYAVEVLDVRDSGATNTDPPKVKLRVAEVLRGEAKPGDEIEATWGPGMCGIDWGGDGMLEAWQKAALAGPAKGSSWIVTSASANLARPFPVWYRGRFEDSKAKRAEVAGLIKTGTEKRKAAEEAQRLHDENLKKFREADAAVQDKIDLAAAAKAAPMVLIARIEGLEGKGEGVQMLGIQPVAWLKGRHSDFGETEELPAMWDLDKDLHLVLEARANDQVILFLEPDEGSSSPSLFGGTNGVLTATPARIKAVREALGLKAEGK